MTNFDTLQWYLDTVFPNVPPAIIADALEAYPLVRLGREPGFVPLAECPVVMFVGLTGTGKSTTLDALKASGSLQYTEAIPSRRQLADLVLIPSALHHQGKSVAKVKDREERFACTGYFAEQIAPGGSAQAFTWLSYHNPKDIIVSEGVRGPNEIAYALANTHWKIVELWVDPLLRLQRLSHRGDVFDAVSNASAADLSFLPASRWDEARALIEAGMITPEAVTTARAEAQNYGAEPYDANNQTPNYLCLNIDTMTPEDIVDALLGWIQDSSVSK